MNRPEETLAACRELRERLLWISLGRVKWEGLVCAGPRDWSPRFEKSRKRLELYRSVIPKELLVSIERMEKAEHQGILAVVRAGLGFVIHYENRLEVVYVSDRGQIVMSEPIRRTFYALLGD